MKEYTIDEYSFHTRYNGAYIGYNFKSNTYPYIVSMEEVEDEGISNVFMQDSFAYYTFDKIDGIIEWIKERLLEIYMEEKKEKAYFQPFMTFNPFE